MKTRLLNLCKNEDDKKKLRVNFEASLFLREKYVELLEKEIEETQTKMLNLDTNTPSWAFQQATLLAEIKAAKKLQNYLK